MLEKRYSNNKDKVDIITCQAMCRFRGGAPLIEEGGRGSSILEKEEFIGLSRKEGQREVLYR